MFRCQAAPNTSKGIIISNNTVDALTYGIIVQGGLADVSLQNNTVRVIQSSSYCNGIRVSAYDGTGDPDSLAQGVGSPTGVIIQGNTLIGSDKTQANAAGVELYTYYGNILDVSINNNIIKNFKYPVHGSSTHTVKAFVIGNTILDCSYASPALGGDASSIWVVNNNYDNVNYMAYGNNPSTIHSFYVMGANHIFAGYTFNCVLIHTNSGDRTVTLPAISTMKANNGQVYYVGKVNTGDGNKVTVLPTGSDTFVDGTNKEITDADGRKLFAFYAVETGSGHLEWAKQ
jgi:hypothetical protein